MKFYTGRYDKVFKTIIASEEHPNMLKTFLSKILEIEIEEITFLKSELEIRDIKEKNKIVDLLVKTKKEYIHVELNSQNKSYLHIRNFCYFTSIYTRKTRTGESYDTNTNFIHIDLTYGMKSNKIKGIYEVRDKEGEKYIEHFTIIEYNMDKIMEFWYTKNKKEIEKYKYLIMLDLDKEGLEEITNGDEFMEEYKKKIIDLNEEETFRSWMTKEEDDKMILNTEKSLSFKEGIKEGTVQSKIEIAKNLLKQGVSINIIKNATKLSEEEIRNLI